MLYSPQCGKKCPYYPRVCYVNHPEQKIYSTVEIDYANLKLVKKYFFRCSKCNTPIEVHDLPKEIRELIPVRRDYD